VLHLVTRKNQAMDHDRLFALAEAARHGRRFSRGDVAFLRDDIPAEWRAYPKVRFPRTIRHPGGFKVSGAPVGTFLRSALLIVGQKAFGRRYGGQDFYERVETDLAMRIMRAHFHGGAPKGAYCCKPCTLAVLAVLEENAIRYFAGPALARDVRRLIAERAWRFETPANAKMLAWSLG
jgi:hypothetical protein